VKKLFDYLREAAQFFVHCYREAARQARESGENPSKYGFREMRETERGPPWFYTENCPEGTYLIGIMTDEENGIKDLRGKVPGDKQEGEDLIIPGSDDTAGPGNRVSGYPK